MKTSGSLKGYPAVHDPAIFKDNGRYYVFGSHMTSARSEDLRNWTMISYGENEKNPLFWGLIGDKDEAFSYVGLKDWGYAVWAPDVIYNKKMEKYVMYFCTTSSYIKSNLCFATAERPEGPYTYADTILYSGFEADSIGETDVQHYMTEEDSQKYFNKDGSYNNLKWPNCIDSNVFYDAGGRMWMVYGSWSGGIFLLELEEATGYPVHPSENGENVDIYYGRRLLGGGHKPIEGPYIMYDSAAAYYYLFVSYGELKRDGGYQIRLFRSRNPEGPYTDATGSQMDAEAFSGYGVKLMGNYSFPSMEIACKAPGHNSAFLDGDGKRYLVYHRRFGDKTERFEARVNRLYQTAGGWLTAAPSAVTEEEDAICPPEKVEGVYYFLNHGLDVNEVIESAQEASLEKGKISGGIAGTYTLDSDGSGISILLDGTAYEGVVRSGADEAGNRICWISAVGNNNQSIWGVSYR